MNSRKPVPVIIPYYKNPEELEKCLLGLDQQKKIMIELFIRDNTYDNILFTKAVNEGLRKYVYNDSFDYILVLNQNAYLNEEALIKLVYTLESNEKIGIAAALQYDENGKITWAGSLDAVPWASNNECVEPFLWGRHNTIFPQQNEPFSTFWANGACFLLRSSMLREIGILDENMLFIYSDVDISLTARIRNWEVVVVPSAICIHSLKNSISQESESLNIIKLADQLYFSYKWLSGKAFKNISYEGKNLSCNVINTEIHKLEFLIKEILSRLEQENTVNHFHKIFSMIDT